MDREKGLSYSLQIGVLECRILQHQFLEQISTILHNATEVEEAGYPEVLFRPDFKSILLDEKIYLTFTRSPP